MLATTETLPLPIDNFHHLLPRLFLALALPVVLFLVFTTPPFMAPDEENHLYRADQISLGEIVGLRRSSDRGDGLEASGGFVESAYLRLFQVCRTPMRSASDRYKAASAVPLTKERQFLEFSNTVLYGPFFYTPQAAALAVARTIGINALQGFYLARLFNGLAAVAIGFLALRLAKRGRFFLFFMLTMPTTLFLFGSVSQDALIIAGAALFHGAVSRLVMRDTFPKVWEIIGLVALLAALACGRLPCLFLGIAFLTTPFSGKSRFRWAGFAALTATAIATLLWAWTMAGLYAHSNLRPSMAQHFGFLSTHFELIPTIAFNTLSLSWWDFARSMFGNVGLLNITLPRFFYYAAAEGFLVALTLETTRPWPLTLKDKIIALSGLLAGIGSVFLALYIVWTNVGNLTVEGVQGRYLIPFVLGLPFVLPTSIFKPRLVFYAVPFACFLPVVALIGNISLIERILAYYY